MPAALRHLQLIDLPFGSQLATLILKETLQNACGIKTFTTSHLLFNGHFGSGTVLEPQTLSYVAKIAKQAEKNQSNYIVSIMPRIVIRKLTCFVSNHNRDKYKS